jgi:hypothetical protein
VLDGDVPQGHLLEQVPVLGDQVVVVRRYVGVVVDVVRRAPDPQRGLEDRDLPYHGPKYSVVESGIVVEAAYDRGRPRHREYLTRERLAGI